ncbi:MAG: hypothetical protein HY814_05830 [Candidatus Riflebacteria bacterium]|nr:hypothetical protein [Candidatus Riflebacteria bacterium]
MKPDTQPTTAPTSASCELDHQELFRLLAEEAFRDGGLDALEKGLLSRFAKFLRLSPEQARAIAREVSFGPPRGIERALDPIVAYRTACAAVCRDGQVSKHELQLLSGLQRLLGLPDDRAAALLEAAREADAGQPLVPAMGATPPALPSEFRGEPRSRPRTADTRRRLEEREERRRYLWGLYGGSSLLVLAIVFALPVLGIIESREEREHARAPFLHSEHQRSGGADLRIPGAMGAAGLVMLLVSLEELWRAGALCLALREALEDLLALLQSLLRGLLRRDG